MSIFKITKQTRRVIATMTLLTSLGLFAAYIYYSNINATEDPRVVEAKNLYDNYNTLPADANISRQIMLLDSIQSIYHKYPHYKTSFEVGVIYNNRSAIYLNYAIHNCEDSLLKINNIAAAGNYSRKSIEIYQLWLEKFQNKTAEEIEALIKDDFQLTELNLSEKKRLKILTRRVEDIQLAQLETARRLSVSYTNMGIVNRHQLKYDAAINNYETAMELWPENLTAKNNLNILFNMPIEKRTMIQKLFPPERVEGVEEETTNNN